MKKKSIILIIVSLILISGNTEGIYAQLKAVNVSIPSFKVTLNDTTVDNLYRQYPLIVYKDITYFPMTYYDSRFLGLETKWDSKNGLDIQTTGISGGYRDYKGKAKNGASFNASVPSFNININGKTIDNSKEQYPLLVFRDVTYFPLTWRFAVEEFGWVYKFDSKNGLVIRSSNPKVKELSFSDFDGKAIIGDGENYYYGGENGAIYQVSNGRNARKVYQLPMWTYIDENIYVNYSLYKNNGDIWLEYHTGGAIMGSDHYIRLNTDGTYDEVESGYLTFKEYGDTTIKVNQWTPPGPNNLSIKYGDEEYREVGDPSYLYGWDWEVRKESAGGSASKDIYLVDNSIYVLGFHMDKDTDYSRLYRVDLNTNETIKLSDTRVSSFVMDWENIYFASDGKIYKISIKDGVEKQIDAEGHVSQYYGIKVLNHSIYYVNDLNNELYRVGSKNSLNPRAKVISLRQDEDYIICLFEENTNISSRIMVFDNEGEVVFKSSDTADNAFVNDDTLVYSNSKDSKVYEVKLK
ncbi:hypothetical protein [Tissierella sp.]|uniref:hypothetical protein n=1 Tax=Tissierella sp. TaxID=41274 RepID=UPI00285E054A|nr:hypothetical protein [Tissierella sp.]MDR7855458.1 hypothetical protein [Tissierella sp.]